LVGLGRLQEAESAFRRAIELRRDWSLPYSAVGALLLRLNRDSDAETALRQAIKIDKQDYLALRMLADIRLRAGDAAEAIDLARRATIDPNAPASSWLQRGMAERATGDKAAAIASFDHVLQLDPQNFAALMERAEVRLGDGDTIARLRISRQPSSRLKEIKRMFRALPQTTNWQVNQTRRFA
jgi:tetratricopeptide (TPR) repeat protein